jgi:transglutaminase-like putative cysteine protease
LLPKDEDGARLPALPMTGVQRTERLAGADGERLIVDLDAPPRPSPLDDEARARHLRATPYLDHRDPAVREVLAAATRSLDPELPDRAVAEVLRRHVGRHLDRKHLSTVLATASETARSHAGDCTEHAVLLAALLRAHDIPSRIALGLIYVPRFAGQNDVFGYHMWAQAHVDGTWIDLDATLGDGPGFDATHLLFSTSALDGDGIPLASSRTLYGFLGGLSIQVEELGPEASSSTSREQPRN